MTAPQTPLGPGKVPAGGHGDASIVIPNPANPQSLNRYSYTLNNPLRYTDPSGHFTKDEIMEYLGFETWDDVLRHFGDAGMLEILDLLRQEDVTWGSILVAGDHGQEKLRGMFLLYCEYSANNNRRYRMTLWDLNSKTGAEIELVTLRQYNQIGIWTDSGNGYLPIDDYTLNRGFGFGEKGIPGTQPIEVPAYYKWYTFGRYYDVDEDKMFFDLALVATRTGPGFYVGAAKFLYELASGKLYEKSHPTITRSGYGGMGNFYWVSPPRGPR